MIGRGSRYRMEEMIFSRAGKCVGPALINFINFLYHTGLSTLSTIIFVMKMSG